MFGVKFQHFLHLEHQLFMTFRAYQTCNRELGRTRCINETCKNVRSQFGVVGFFSWTGDRREGNHSLTRIFDIREFRWSQEKGAKLPSRVRIAFFNTNICTLECRRSSCWCFTSQEVTTHAASLPNTGLILYSLLFDDFTLKISFSAPPFTSLWVELPPAAGICKLMWH